LHLLEVKDIRVLYGKAVALNGLSISLSPNEMVGVVGPNGAGKTTLLRAISGVVPIEGEILYKGDRLNNLTPHEIVGKGIIHCPERRQIFVEFTVEENLEMGAFLRKDKQGIQNDFDHVYSLFPVLSERRNQVAGTLSGGLSPLVKNQLADSIADIWKSGITVLIVEQDASLTLELTQRVYIMEHGKVGLEGKSDELIDNEEVKRVYFQLG
jgi:branched-chain amino acid transport system ATP-binding protein